MRLWLRSGGWAKRSSIRKRGSHRAALATGRERRRDRWARRFRSNAVYLMEGQIYALLLIETEKAWPESQTLKPDPKVSLYWKTLKSDPKKTDPKELWIPLFSFAKAGLLTRPVGIQQWVQWGNGSANRRKIKKGQKRTKTFLVALSE